MRNVLLTVFRLSASLVAADMSGKWSGSVVSGGGQPQSIYVILKLDGNQLTGSAGPSASEQNPMQKGKVQGDRLTFEVPTGKGTFVFDLKMEEDQISGDLEFRSPEQTGKARVSLKRCRGE
jgi:hypothetical protein